MLSIRVLRYIHSNYQTNMLSSQFFSWKPPLRNTPTSVLLDFLDSSVHNLRIVLDKRMVTKPCLFSWIIFWGLHFQSTSQKRNFLVRTVYDWFSVFHHCDETKKKIQSAAFSKKHTHSNTQSYQIHIHTIFFLQKKTYFKSRKKIFFFKRWEEREEGFTRL